MVNETNGHDTATGGIMPKMTPLLLRPARTPSSPEPETSGTGADAPATMRAVFQDVYGAADVLELREVLKPLPAEAEVLVHVHAAGVDRSMLHLMTGRPYPVRLSGYGLRAPRMPVPGVNLAGVVESVGVHVTTVRPGDEVFGIGAGAFAEYALAPQDKLAPMPANLSFEQAAAVPVSGLTALQALRDFGRVKAGQKVLIVGASGGVGTFAVQLANAFGAEVSGVCGTAKTDLVRSLGAAHVIDYTRGDFTSGGARYDVILDVGGKTSVSRLRRMLGPKGTLVLVGRMTGGRWLGGYGRGVWARLLSWLVGPELAWFARRESHEDLAVLRDLIESGRITPVIDRTFPLAAAAEAIRYLERGYVRGKVVVTPV